MSTIPTPQQPCIKKSSLPIYLVKRNLVKLFEPSTSLKCGVYFYITFSIQQPMMPIGKSSTPRAIAENLQILIQN